MALFPQSFIDELRMHADIVLIVQDYVSLKRTGANYVGLCPFHAEKTPSFSVNRERGFFHCFGCGVGGDVFKFVELQEGLGFPETVRRLAARFGLTVPEVRDGGRDRHGPSAAQADTERETLLRAHEVAARFFQDRLQAAEGRAARQQLADRGVTPETTEVLGLGYAPGRGTLLAHLKLEGFPTSLLLKSGLVAERDGGAIVDRFRNRLMIPICRESGSVVAFGGRAMEAEQLPKYLNSPETPLYTKSRVLYGLHLTKGEVRKAQQAVLVEGYFDFAQAWQGGVRTVAATCGTALSVTQAHLLRRFTSRVVLNFDADAAGHGAALRSCDLLVAEGFQVAVAVVAPGEDPDTFVRRHGGEAYESTLRAAQPYLDYVVDRAAARVDMATPEGRLAFLDELLPVAARIPNAAGRDQFGDRVAHRAQIGEEVVRQQIRKAAVTRQTRLPGETRSHLGGAGRGASGQAVLLTAAGRDLKRAERELLAGLLTRPGEAMAALAELEPEDLDGLGSSGVLREALGLGEVPPEAIPTALLERLSKEDAQMLTGLATRLPVPSAPVECVRALRLLRYQRERTAAQLEIDRLQELGLGADAAELQHLMRKTLELKRRIETLET
ncbi:MAG: DNA primase [Luteitalea sp.]|nr:DNA primase [Luteitalea sp.]